MLNIVVPIFVLQFGHGKAYAKTVWIMSIFLIYVLSFNSRLLSLGEELMLLYISKCVCTNAQTKISASIYIFL